MISKFHDQLASLDKHAQLTRCFSVVADLFNCLYCYRIPVLTDVLSSCEMFTSLPGFVDDVSSVECDIVCVVSGVVVTAVVRGSAVYKRPNINN